jgi:hypothetical protein
MAAEDENIELTEAETGENAINDFEQQLFN